MNKVFAVFTLAAVVFAAACEDHRAPMAPEDGSNPFNPVFDDIFNNLDATIDAVAEAMPLTLGGPNGTTTLYVQPTNGDGKNGCNLTGSTTLTVSVASSNTAIATVSPTSATFASCGDTKTLTVTPVGVGAATISISQTLNSTGGSFNLATATFTVNVAAPPNTAPVISVTGVTAGASYDKGSVPAAMCSVEDAEDGNSSFAATLGAIAGPYASDGIGTQEASCSYTDGGGLTASASVTYEIVDPSAPSISYVLNPVSADGDNGWYKSNVTLTWTVADLESPNSLQKVGCDDQSITADQVETNYSCSATSAGGTTGPTSVSIKRDATAPSLNHTGTAPALPNGNNGWYTTDVTATFTASDVTSGLADAAQANFVRTSNAEGTDVEIASGSVADNAGNVTPSIDAGPFMIDKTRPTVTVNGVANGATYTLGSVPTASCTTTDALSGVATHATVSFSGGPVGPVTATCSGAEDNAGNDAANSVTYNVIYDWNGFFRPVDNAPTINQVKAGSAVPIKFSLDGNQGLDIMATGYPKSAPAACDASATVDNLEETVTAGSSSLSYDPLTDQYIYVWKTQKTWTGCHQLVVKLNDGTEHKAIFKLMK
jgi:hypothetical protein